MFVCCVCLFLCLCVFVFVCVCFLCGDVQQHSVSLVPMCFDMFSPPMCLYLVVVVVVVCSGV